MDEHFKPVLSHLFLNQDSFCKGDHLWSVLFYITHFNIGNHLHGSETQSYKKGYSQNSFLYLCTLSTLFPPQEAAQVISFLCIIQDIFMSF